MGTNWHEAAKLDTALGGAVTVLCLAPDPRGYGVNVRAPDFVGRNAVIVSNTLTPEQIEGTFGPYFDDLRRETDIVVPRNGQPALTLRVYRARRLHEAPGASVNLLDPLGAWSGHIVPAH